MRLSSILILSVALLGTGSLAARGDGILPCLSGAAGGATPAAGLCRDVAAALLGPATQFGLSVLPRDRGAAPALAALGHLRPAALAAPSAPWAATSAPLLRTPGWQRHMQQVVALYRENFEPRGGFALPAVPAALWPGGNPFADRRAVGD
ncbi:hypothetical protein [Acidisoma sp. C75]